MNGWLEDITCYNSKCSGTWVGSGDDRHKTRMVMLHVRIDDYYFCPVCGQQCWRPTDREDRKVTTREALAAWRAEQQYKDSIRKHGGGSRPAGRKRRKEKKFYPVRLSE